jgi:hypothetical protein
MPGGNIEQHHPFCKATDLPSAGCQHCAFLTTAYPIRAGETAAEATARYFPPTKAMQAATPAALLSHDLVMVQRGRKIMRSDAPMIEAHAVNVAAPLAEIEDLLRQRQERLRKMEIRKAAERTRVAQMRNAASRQANRRVGNAVVEIDGEKTTVRRVKTTIGKMEKEGKLPPDLAVQVYAFARRVAAGLGVATEDEHDATSRLTGPYSPMAALSGFSSRTPSDRQIDGISTLRTMSRRVPAELMPIFEQIIEEEIIGQSRLGRTLAELGEALGYKHKQQIPAGSALVYATVALIAHFMRDSQLGVPDPARPLRSFGDMSAQR